MGLYGYQPDPATAEYPLALISPASDRTISSTLGELSRPEVRLEINPDDAEARGIERRRCDSCVERARRDADQRAHLPTGRRAASSRCRKACGAATRRTATRRTRSCRIRLSDLGGGACFNDARVQVEKMRPK